MPRSCFVAPLSQPIGGRQQAALEDITEDIVNVSVKLFLSITSEGFRALKHFSLTGHPWLSMWDLEMKLQRKRCADPALSWADRCEGPSMR
jgi:hypothetical protein